MAREWPTPRFESGARTQVPTIERFEMTVPKVKTFSAKGSRFYISPLTGESVPGVTSILGQLPKPFLQYWSAKMVAEYAFDNVGVWQHLDRQAAVDLLKAAPRRYTGSRADIGSEAHDAFEKIGNGEDPGPQRIEVAPYVDQFKRFLDDFQPEFIGQELTVWSDTHRYAGSTDAFLRIAGEPVVADWKTTKSVYPEVALQLAAYRYADHVIDQYGTTSPIPKLEGGAVLHVREDGYDLIPMRCDEQVFEMFVALRNGPFEWSTDVSKTVIGAPLRPSAVV